MYRILVPNWTKQQFVDWAVARYKEPKSHFNKMKKKQLMAIFINTGRKGYDSRIY